MSGAGTLGQLTETIGLAFASLSDELTPKRLAIFLLEMGLEEITDLSNDAAFTQKVSTAVAAVTALTTQLSKLEQASSDGDLPSALAAVAAVGQSLGAGFNAFDAVAADLQRAAQAAGGAPSAASLSAVLVDRIIEYAVVGQLERSTPVTLCLLELFTVVERNAATLGSGADAVTVLRRRIYPDRLTKLINNPLSLLQAGYGWGTATPQFPLLLERLARLLLAADILVGDVLDQDGNPTQGVGLDLFALTLGPTANIAPPGLAINLVDGSAASSIIPLYQPSPEWQLSLELDGNFAQDLSLQLLPPDRLALGTTAASPPGGATLRLVGQASDPSSPFVILAIAGGSQLSAKTVTVVLTWSEQSNNPASGELSFAARVAGGVAVLSSQGSDGFVAQILPGQFSADFDFGLTWSAEQGFAFSGGVGLDTTIPIGLQLGPISVPSLHLALSAANVGIQAELSTTVGAGIGPFQVLIDRVGLLLTIDTTRQRGNLGITEVALSFKPPSGAGLTIDAAGVSGGGFLAHANDQYSGVLQLKFNDLALQAFGLITTQVAGANGYSLIALIDSNFPPVQLGWGFTLDGIGGLLAVNRTASVDALRAAVKSGKLSSILFPTAAISNASQMLSMLDTFFPTAPGRFLFGPMALIEWGTPAVLTASVAVILELPEPIAIILLANIAAKLPTPSAPLVHINMDALGVLDLTQGELSLDASLFDSKLISFPITGDMALRADWSSQREFLLAIGGFHPQFTPPAGFPSLNRVTINMPSGIVSKLRLAAYLAITSNSVQFGATLDAYIGVSGCGITGHLGFDAILQLDPFQFSADISGSVAVTVGGDDLASVSLDATLSGPAPWHIAGSFKIHIIFFDIGVSFSASWGLGAPSQPVSTVDVGALLNTALADPRNWNSQLPPGVAALVSTRQVSDPNTIFAHPLAMLEVHEQVVPLGLAIARFGQALPSGAIEFSITSFNVGGQTTGYTAVQDDFAPAQFFDLSDNDKLSRPSFERHDAGAVMSGNFVTNGAARAKTVNYETYYINTPGVVTVDEGVPQAFPWSGLQFVMSTGAAARKAIGRSGSLRYAAPGNPIKVQEPAFAVAGTANLATASAPAAAGPTYSDAAAALRSVTAALRAGLQIVGTHELA
jgi:hypothetical protein